MSESFQNEIPRARVERDLKLNLPDNVTERIRRGDLK